VQHLKTLMNNNLKSEITVSINRTKELLDSKILWETKENKFKQSVLIEVLINLKDLLIKSDKHLGKRISCTDDIIPDDKLKIYDLTGLISNFRDASCHNDSFRRKYGSSVLSFNSLSGKGVLMQIGDLVIESKYEDDIIYNMGTNVLYLKRHIEKAFIELEINFKPYLLF